MDLIREVTPYVTGTSERLGGSGDPSPATAWGVLHAMQAVARAALGRPIARGPPRGRVGRRQGRRARSSRHLVEAGAQVTVSDVRGDAVGGARRRARRRDGRPRPGAHGRVRRVLAVRARRGAAARRRSPSCAARRSAAAPTTSWPTRPTATGSPRRGVLYAPDFVANAGGVINIADETASGRLRPRRGVAARRGDRGHGARRLRPRRRRRRHARRGRRPDSRGPLRSG